MIEVNDYNEVRQFRIARTIAGHGLYFTAAYLVDGLMIDTGSAHAETELLSLLEDTPVEQIAHTHSHEDHIGATGAIQERFGVPAFIHPSGLPVLEAPVEKQPLRPYQRIMWGYPRGARGSAVGPEIKTGRCCFKMIPTPGHSIDHICLFEPGRGWLFTGDAFVGGKDRALRADFNIRGILASLKKLARLEPRIMFTASGSVRKNPIQDLADKISYLEETGQKIMELHRQGLSCREIRKKLFGPEMAIRYFTLGHFSGLNLVRSYIEPIEEEYDE